MLFADITTPAEQRIGFIAADVVIERCLNHEDYLKNVGAYKGSTGGGVIEAEIYFDERAYSLLVYRNLVGKKNDQATGLYWQVDDFELDGFADLKAEVPLVGYVPLTRTALLASLSSTFGLCPERLAAEAVDNQAYWQGESITDFSKPVDALLDKYRLMR